jgi:hypothetical protein
MKNKESKNGTHIINSAYLAYSLRSPRLCGKLMKNQPQRRKDAKRKISTQNSLFLENSFECVLLILKLTALLTRERGTGGELSFKNKVLRKVSNLLNTLKFIRTLYLFPVFLSKRKIDCDCFKSSYK